MASRHICKWTPSGRARTVSSRNGKMDDEGRGMKGKRLEELQLRRLRDGGEDRSIKYFGHRNISYYILYLTVSK